MVCPGPVVPAKGTTKVERLFADDVLGRLTVPEINEQIAVFYAAFVTSHCDLHFPLKCGQERLRGQDCQQSLLPTLEVIDHPAAAVMKR